MSINNTEVFIVGLPRSGTTLVSKILNCSKEVYIIPETHYYFLFVKKYDRLKYFFKKRGYQRLAKFFVNKSIATAQLDNKEKRNIISRASINYNRASLLKSLFNYYKNVKDADRIGEKTPGHFIYYKKIIKDFPEGKFVIIIRDPRDIYSSLQKTTWGNHWSLLKIVFLWKKMINKFWNNNNFESIFVLKYEELLINFETTVERMCKFLQIDFSIAMREYYNNDAANNFDSIIEPWKKNCNLPLIKTNFNKWKKELSKAEQQVFNFFLYDEFIKCAYETQAVGSISSLIWNIVKSILTHFKIVIYHITSKRS